MCLSLVEHLRMVQVAAMLGTVRTVPVQLPQEMLGGDLPEGHVSLLARLGTGVAITGVTTAAIDIVERAENARFMSELERLRVAVAGVPPPLLRVKFVRAKAVESVMRLVDRFRELAAGRQAMAEDAGKYVASRCSAPHLV